MEDWGTIDEHLTDLWLTKKFGHCGVCGNDKNTSIYVNDSNYFRISCCMCGNRAKVWEPEIERAILQWIGSQPYWEDVLGS